MQAISKKQMFYAVLRELRLMFGILTLLRAGARVDPLKQNHWNLDKREKPPKVYEDLCTRRISKEQSL